MLHGGDFCSFDDCSPGEWEGGRQAKVGENARPWLQRMGALRPDLPIEAMIKIKMVAVEAEVIRLDILRFTPTPTSNGEVNNELNITYIQY